MKEFMLARLKEPSSWRGAIWVLTAFGLIALKGEQAEAIIAFGMAMAGGVSVVTPDKLH
jgi:predicted anti-sigma-YlaC factor YlaD